MEVPKSAQRTATLIWASLLPTPALLGIAAWLATTPAESGLAVPIDYFAPGVLVPAVVALGIFMTAGAMGRFSTTPTGEDLPAMQRRMVVSMVRWALYESIAAAGLLAAVLGGVFGIYLPFMVLAWIGLVLSKPGN